MLHKETTKETGTTKEATTKKRVVYTIAQRKEAIITAINGMTEPLNKDAIIALLNKELETKGNSTTKIEPKTVDGITYYFCSRSGKWFKLDNMVTTKDGKTKGYSKVSQDALTAWNKKHIELETAVIDASRNGDYQVIPTLAKKLQEFEATSDKKYMNIKGDIQIN